MDVMRRLSYGATCLKALELGLHRTGLHRLLRVRIEAVSKRRAVSQLFTPQNSTPSVSGAGSADVVNTTGQSW